MPKFLRFSDLRAGGIVSSWPQLRRMINEYGFPAGRLLSPNVRIWTEEEVAEYIATRPTEPKPSPKRSAEAA